MNTLRKRSFILILTAYDHAGMVKLAMQLDEMPPVES